MNTFTLNGKEYTARAFDFNMICDLEDFGVAIEQAQEKPMSLVRAYFALCCGGDKEYAGKEIGNHVINGGTFDEIMDAISKEMDESDFFQGMNKGLTDGANSTKAKKVSTKK